MEEASKTILEIPVNTFTFNSQSIHLTKFFYEKISSAIIKADH